MIEGLLAKKATWWAAGLLTGILGPVVSSALQDIIFYGFVIGTPA